MKIIVSHDVDHLTVREHCKDLIVPKYMTRSLLEWWNHSISFAEYCSRWKELCYGKWQNIHELVQFDRRNQIPTTFFVALHNGLGLSYPAASAIPWIHWMRENKCDVGLHGMAYRTTEDICREHEEFKSIVRQEHFGVRMHYLKYDSQTLESLSRAGYLFDSTEWGMKDCYPVGSMWEFPLHLMDVHEIFEGGRIQRKSASAIISKTQGLVDQARSRGFRYLTLLFHDRYFSRYASAFQDWYLGIIDYLKMQNLRFSNYREAIQELNRHHHD